MSSFIPALEACVPQLDSAVPTDRPELPPFAALPAFEPRQSLLVSWPVRMAQVAERVVARALPARQTANPANRGLAEITLAGLDRCCWLMPYHQEVVVAERARLRIQQAVEQRAERHRRFLELKRTMPDLRLSLGDDGTSQLHLNPANCWIRWTTDSGPSDSGPAAQEAYSQSALFFLDGSGLRGIRMRLEGQVLINELADYEPCTVAQWARLSALADAEQLTQLARHLVEIGLVAHT
jgi:hypothetical protein